MDWKKLIGPLLLVAGIAGLVASKYDIQIPWDRITPIVQREVATNDRLLVLVHEKTTPTADEVLAVRSAKDFVAERKLRQFLSVDPQDPWVFPLEQAANKANIRPPYLALAKPNSDGTFDVERIRPFQKELGDILK